MPVHTQKLEEGVKSLVSRGAGVFGRHVRIVMNAGASTPVFMIIQ